LLAGGIVAAGRLHGAVGDRPDYWRVAWHEAQANPVLGSGAGTFELWWEDERPIDVDVRDAHSLYVETLAEQGAAGLLLLAAALGIPLFLAWSRREAPLVPAATAAYAAFLVHAGVDWDWEMPAVTLAALVAAAVPIAGTIAPVPRTGVRDEDTARSAGAAHLLIDNPLEEERT
jgi:hypothetical protein